MVKLAWCLQMNNKITESQLLTKDLISGGDVVKILDFGQHAYADTFIAEDQQNLSEPVFPLQLYLNPESGGIQLGYVSDAKDRYNLYSYSYTSSNSKTARDHWEEYARWVKSKFSTAGLVVEIGSNDAYLLKQFKAEGTKPLGIDSSKAMCEIALTHGINTLQTLFGSTVGTTVRGNFGSAKLVMANNVFNHANDPVDFAQGVTNLLENDGVFVFELPYWSYMVSSGRFTDMVYHEHITYFTIKSTWNLLKAAGLELIDFEIVNYHGGSIRGVARLDRGSEMPEKIAKAIEEETEAGLFLPEFYSWLQGQFVQQRNRWMKEFYELVEQDPDAVIIGVGAAAKANTWLTWYGLNKSHIHCIADSSAYKQGKYTPLSRIPIRGDEEFAKHENPYALILSWNISEPLKHALLNINPNTRFISQ